VTVCIVVNVVASVGPYPLTNRTDGNPANTRAQCSTDNTSPPAINTRNPANPANASSTT
jgi:hypothetical protein